MARAENRPTNAEIMLGLLEIIHLCREGKQYVAKANCPDLEF